MWGRGGSLFGVPHFYCPHCGRRNGSIQLNLIETRNPRNDCYLERISGSMSPKDCNLKIFINRDSLKENCYLFMYWKGGWCTVFGFFFLVFPFLFFFSIFWSNRVILHWDLLKKIVFSNGLIFEKWLMEEENRSRCFWFLLWVFLFFSFSIIFWSSDVNLQCDLWKKIALFRNVLCSCIVKVNISYRLCFLVLSFRHYSSITSSLHYSK